MDVEVVLVHIHHKGVEVITDSYSPTSRHGDPGLIPGLATWNFWWGKWDRGGDFFFLHALWFPLPIFIQSTALKMLYSFDTGSNKQKRTLLVRRIFVWGIDEPLGFGTRFQIKCSRIISEFNVRTKYFTVTFLASATVKRTYSLCVDWLACKSGRLYSYRAKQVCRNPMQ
jgi:hypothetical protein